MDKRGRLAVGSIVMALLLGGGAANAATVYPESGAVFANNGDGFVRINSAIQAQPGAQVLTRPGGSATINYDGACVVRVGPGELKLVESTAPCTTTGSLKDAPVVAEEKTDLTPLVIGGALAATVVGITTSQGGGDKPASP
jgi:hypothetical protein